MLARRRLPLRAIAKRRRSGLTLVIGGGRSTNLEVSDAGPCAGRDGDAGARGTEQRRCVR
jgi:hypothetical protein